MSDDVTELEKRIAELEERVAGLEIGRAKSESRIYGNTVAIDALIAVLRTKIRFEYELMEKLEERIDELPPFAVEIIKNLLESLRGRYRI